MSSRRLRHSLSAVVLVLVTVLGAATARATVHEDSLTFADTRDEILRMIPENAT